MPGTHPEMTIPATAPGESGPLAAKTDPPSPLPASSVPGWNPSGGGSDGSGDDPPLNIAALASRRESVALKEGLDKKSETAQLKQFVNDGRHFSLVRNFRLADLVTLLNGFCGAMSLYASANYLITSDLGYLWQALWLPLGGLFFDFLDGRVARWRNESSMLGQELDSLADSVSFGVAPSVLAFAIGLRTPLDTVVLAGFVCCGIARLARFNATVAHAPKDASGKSKYFEGLPIPSTLVLVGAMAECVRRGWIEGPGGSGQGLPFGLVEQLLPYKVAVHWETGIFGIWAAMMVSKTLRVPKP